MAKIKQSNPNYEQLNLNYLLSEIKTIRKNKNISQKTLAEKIGISQQHLSKIETGQIIPSLSTYIKILQILGAHICVQYH